MPFPINIANAPTLRRGVFLLDGMRFPSEAASKLNAIRCITPLLCAAD